MSIKIPSIFDFIDKTIKELDDMFENLDTAFVEPDGMIVKEVTEEERKPDGTIIIRKTVTRSLSSVKTKT